MIKTPRFALALIASVAIAACGSNAAEESHHADGSHHSGGEAAAAATTAATALATSDIVDTAVAAGSFNTLVAAVQAAGLVDTLKSEGPFTVFAPTDAAFAALPEGTVDNLLLPENRDQLVQILTYHVVSGDVRAAQVVGMTSAPTVAGMDLAIATDDSGVTINNARVTQADIACSNGVIHVIDQVLLPN